MPEILTESFCERCGTRYTFESAAPRKTRRLGSFKTLSKGLKNYVLSDDTSMDEAMAAARSDEEREATAQQLDAFHATFNFCMNCRQYTCGNCWNQAEGRCLTCAPNLGQEILPAAFPELTTSQPFAAEAWPTADLPTGEPPLEEIFDSHSGNGAHGATAPEIEAEPSNGVSPELEPLEDIDVGARLSFLTMGRSPAEAATDEPAPAEPVATEPVSETQAKAASADAIGVEPTIETAAASELDQVADRASELIDHTSILLGRFRPGQNIDAELDAYEAGLARMGAEPEPVAATGESETAATAPEPEPIAVEPVAAASGALAAEAEPTAAAIEPAAEPVAVEPEVIAAQPEPMAAAAEAESEPIAAAAEPESEPIVAPEPVTAEPPAEAPRVDRIQQPTWQIFAPDLSVRPPVPPTPTTRVPAPPAAQASSEPQWPTQPDWQESPSMALLANRSKASSDALWAASAQEVLSPPATGPAAPVSGVQPCSNCGLSLSATARFCRRCGTRQG